MFAAKCPVEERTEWKLDWAHGSARVQALGAMLAPVRLRLDGGRLLDVMHVAPWGEAEMNAAAASALPGLMRRLRGEWPCMPFGRADLPPDLPAGWEGKDATDGWPHGYASNHDWYCLSADAGHVHLRIDYPADAPVASMERIVRCDPRAPALDITLAVTVRRPVRMPAGLHPTFRLPGNGRQVRLLLNEHAGIFSYPTNPDAACSLLLPDTRSDSLACMAGKDGPLALDRLPLAGLNEELLQVRAPAAHGRQPPFALHYLDEDACVGLWWDTAKLPDLMLWVSNGGRSHFPWNSRHLALGAEPVNSLFDLGRVARAPAGHPLADRLGVELTPDQPWRTSYRIAAWVPSKALPAP